MGKYESAIEYYLSGAEDYVFNDEKERGEAKERAVELLREATETAVYDIYEEPYLKF